MHRFASATALLPALVLGAGLRAQSQPASPVPPSPPPAHHAESFDDDTPHLDEAPPQRLHGSIGVSFTTAYYFRGILQERDGAIAQPWFEFTRPIEVGGPDDLLQQVDLTFGSWSSLHDGPTGSGGGASMWYEHDFYASLGTGLGERVRVEALYTSYYSPNASFGTVQEVGGRVAFDDGDLWGEGFAGLQPSVMAAAEVSGQADAGTARATYLELGIAPGLEVGEGDLAGLNLSLPVTVGLGLGDYYENGADSSAFGFLDVGLVLSQSSADGDWTGELGLHGLWLGSTNEARNDNDAFELVLGFSLSTAF